MWYNTYALFETARLDTLGATSEQAGLTEVYLMSAQIFISYRREDTASEAGRICSAIRQALGEDAVFMDTASLQAGAIWPQEIQAALKAAETILVIIGPQWLLAGSNEWGQRRIDQAHDWVRQELSLALKENKTVIPVLVRGARMPPAEVLPQCIHTLPDRQKLDIRNEYWNHDIQLLLTRLPGWPLKPLRPNGSKPGEATLWQEVKREVTRNVEYFLLILTSPQKFIASINHSSHEQLISASLFAIIISLINLAIHFPLYRLLKVQTESVSYVIADTILTYGFLFLYGSGFHLCARLLHGKGSYPSSLCAYLYLTAFSPLILLVSFPNSVLFRRYLMEKYFSNSTTSSLSIELLLQLTYEILGSPKLLLSMIIGWAVLLWYYISIVIVYKTIHSVGMLRAMMIAILGISLWKILAVIIEFPILQMMWEAYKHGT